MRVSHNKVLAKIRRKNLERKAVPQVVLQRRRPGKENEDPAAPILKQVDVFGKKHGQQLRDLAIRSMGMNAGLDFTNNFFASVGMDGVKVDSSTTNLINNAIRRVSEILVFKMVAEELVMDKELSDQLLKLFINQRFEAYGRPPTTEAKGKSDTDKLLETLQKFIKD